VGDEEASDTKSDGVDDVLDADFEEVNEDDEKKSS
jgi:hypothetical protein